MAILANSLSCIQISIVRNFLLKLKKEYYSIINISLSEIRNYILFKTLQHASTQAASKCLRSRIWNVFTITSNGFDSKAFHTRDTSARFQTQNSPLGAILNPKRFLNFTFLHTQKWKYIIFVLEGLANFFAIQASAGPYRHTVSGQKYCRI